MGARRRPMARYQRGATMAEFVVVSSFVLVPLMILMPMMGKYIDTRHKVEQAARYAAWEHTAWFDPASPAFTGRAAGMLPFALKSKDEAEIANEIQARILSKADTSVHANQGTDDDIQPLDAMQHYTNRANGKYEPLLKVKTGGKQGFYGEHNGSETAPSGPLSQGINVVLSMGDVLGFEVNKKGLYTSQFELDVHEPSGLKVLLPSLDIKFTAQHMLFTDGWGAGGKEHNASMVQGLLPTELLNNNLVNTIQSIASVVPIAKEAAPNRLVFGYVDVDAMPDQRLSNENH